MALSYSSRDVLSLLATRGLSGIDSVSSSAGRGTVDAESVGQLPVSASWTDVWTSSWDARGSSASRDLWVRRARYVSYFSIGFTLFGAVTGLVVWCLTSSTALLGYSLESFVDVWSSILVLWRFSGAERDVKAMARKEVQAEVGIAFTFVGIAAVVGTQGWLALLAGEGTEQGGVLLTLSSVSLVLLSLLCVAKLRIAQALKSPAMEKDGITSGAVAILSLGVLVSEEMSRLSAAFWWMDAAVGMAVAVVMLVYGCTTLYHQPWWRSSFWQDHASSPLSQAP